MILTVHLSVVPVAKRDQGRRENDLVAREVRPGPSQGTQERWDRLTAYKCCGCVHIHVQVFTSGF